MEKKPKWKDFTKREKKEIIKGVAIHQLKWVFYTSLYAIGSFIINEPHIYFMMGILSGFTYDILKRNMGE